MKKLQAKLIQEIIIAKNNIQSKQDFERLMKLVDTFRELNYSKKRKVRTLTP
jgi:hypothetical protein